MLGIPKEGDIKYHYGKVDTIRTMINMSSSFHLLKRYIGSLEWFQDSVAHCLFQISEYRTSGPCCTKHAEWQEKESLRQLSLAVSHPCFLSVFSQADHRTKSSVLTYGSQKLKFLSKVQSIKARKFMF